MSDAAAAGFRARSDRVAVVTGAAGGLGHVVAREFARDGFRLALVGSRQERLDALAGDLGLPAERCLTVAADLREEPAARAAFERIAERLGPPAVLAHLVGGWTGGTPLTELAPDEMATMLGQHLWTTFHAVRAVVPAMRAEHWGRIVAVSSPAAADPPPRMAAYSVAKAAQETLLRGLARELEGSGVTANVLLVRSIAVEDAQGEANRPASSTSAGEIVAAIRWLCSEAGGIVNGARIPLFGG